MFNLNLNLLEKNSLYEDFVDANPNLTKSQKLIIKALLVTESVEETMFITDESLSNISDVYSLIKNFLSEQDVVSKQEIIDKENKSISENGEKPLRKQIDRSAAVNYVIDKLKANNNDFRIIKKSYNIIKAILNGKEIMIKIKLSTNYDKHHIGSWHKEDPRQISEFDYHIYVTEDTVNDNFKYRTLIFRTTELQEELLSKKKYKADFVNYYFNWKDGEIYDDRESTAQESNKIKVGFADADISKNWILK